MKRTGKAALLAFLILLPSTGRGQTEITADLEETVIEAGERTVLKVTIPAEVREIRPLRVPTVPGITISYFGPSIMYRNINGREWRGVVLSYTITGARKGKYRIPPFIFDVRGDILKTRELALTVSGDAPRTGSPRGGQGDLRGAGHEKLGVRRGAPHHQVFPPVAGDSLREVQRHVGPGG